MAFYLAFYLKLYLPFSLAFFLSFYPAYTLTFSDWQYASCPWINDHQISCLNFVIQHRHEELPMFDDLPVHFIVTSIGKLHHQRVPQSFGLWHRCIHLLAQVMLSLRGWQTLKEVATQVDILIIGSFMASGTWLRMTFRKIADFLLEFLFTVKGA